ncbi:MAG: D-cysteine desulfhydrase family protein [Deltaproteobacteria bacterium]|nr:D-cysteine desulfhydrase family protein [Deltaproteobacteria bacterium]MCB9788177.1 D-cysteine desulfhydrase family protein [Deltaproteobacteria bacterium]
MHLPEHLPLAHLPTPIQAMPRLSDALGVEVLVKRDDLTGSHLSGNKVRKLEFLLARAAHEGATHVVTCGGVQSNHCRATALAAAPLGMKPVLLLRTPHGRPDELPEPPTGNVLLDRLAGATLHLCDPAGYRERTRRMAELARAITAEGGRPFVIPEGGSDALGALGYVRCAAEIAEQLPDALPSSVVVATGSGGTVAGLALGFRALELPVRTVGVAVCDDEATFMGIAADIAAEARTRYGLQAPADEGLRIVDGFQGRGYALSTPDELALLRDTARLDGLVLDPVYTLKAFRALLSLAPSGALGPRVLFVHTGGIFGLFAASDALAPLL